MPKKNDKKYVDAARKLVCSELLAPQSASCHGALREIMVSDDHARLARSLRDCVAFSAAGWSDHCQDARPVCTEEGEDLSGGHRPCEWAPLLRQSFPSAEHLQPKGLNAR